MRSAKHTDDKLATEYSELLRNYRELADGVRLIRRAVQRACRAGVLPAIDEVGRSPQQECEAIARAIYKSALASRPHHGAPLAGLTPDDSSNSS
jgi:hypothetical protein